MYISIAMKLWKFPDCKMKNNIMHQIQLMLILQSESLIQNYIHLFQLPFIQPSENFDMCQWEQSVSVWVYEGQKIMFSLRYVFYSLVVAEYLIFYFEHR